MGYWVVLVQPDTAGIHDMVALNPAPVTEPSETNLIVSGPVVEVNVGMFVPM